MFKGPNNHDPVVYIYYSENWIYFLQQSAWESREFLELFKNYKRLLELLGITRIAKDYHALVGIPMKE